MRTDDRGHHYVDCMFCGTEWIVSKFAKEPYACPYCRAMYKKFNRAKQKNAGVTSTGVKRWLKLPD